MLRRFFHMVPQFGRDRGGNVAIIFGLSVVPVVGLAGGAVDVHRASRDMAALQSAFDAAAVAGARKAALGAAVVRLEAQNHLDANLSAGLRGYPVRIEVSDAGKMVTISTDAATMPTAFLGIVGLSSLNIVAKAKAVWSSNQTIPPKPVIAQLDPEAGDYNRLYAYCYNPSRRNQPDQGRSQMTAIADNAGTVYNASLPRCNAETEGLAYRLYNVRNARTNRSLWDNARPGTLTRNDPTDQGGNFFNYYTDTVWSSDRKLTHNLPSDVPILETLICDTLAECKNKSQGGIIPTGKNRTPQQATKACEPGKFLYLGWEDRPPSPDPRRWTWGWTDGDYDDIRVIVECPPRTTDTTIVVRLVE